MIQEIKSWVEIDATLKDTSIALNGLVNLDKDIKRVKIDYELDCKRDKLLNHCKEKQSLGIIYKNFLSLSIHLTELNEVNTRMDYRLTYIKVGIAQKILFILSGFYGLLGILLILSIGVNAGGIAIAAILFVVALILALIAVITMWIGRTEQKMDQLFHNYLLSRLNEYIKIVEEHKSQTK